MKKIKEKEKDCRPFSQRHKNIYLLFCFFILMVFLSVMGLIGYGLIKIFINIIKSFIDYISGLSDKLDAVIIVALITGTVSIVGVITSSIIAKGIDYRKSRKQYLAQKREDPYKKFVEFFYKVNEKKENGQPYSIEELNKDLSSFSEQLTLWGSKRVSRKWVEYRKRSKYIENVAENLFMLEEMMNLMRADLGTGKLSKGELLAFKINDSIRIASKK